MPPCGLQKQVPVFQGDGFTVPRALRVQNANGFSFGDKLQLLDRKNCHQRQL
jgi:hypothetical protein